MKNIARVAMALVMAVGLASCGDDDASSTGGPDGDEIPGLTASTEPAGSADSGPAEDAELAGRVLGVEDFPEGWRQEPPGDSGMGALACFHLINTPAIGDRIVSDIQRAFNRGGAMPMVNQIVMQFDTPTDAAEVMDLLDEQVQYCSTFPGVAQVPGPSPGSDSGFRPFSLDDVDAVDGVSAWQMSGDVGAGLPLAVTAILIRQGELVTTLLSVDMGTDEVGPVVDLAPIAAERLS